MKKYQVIFIIAGSTILLLGVIIFKLNHTRETTFPGTPLEKLKDTHLRIYLDEDRVVSLKEKIETSHADIWENIRGWVDEKIDSSPPPQVEGYIRRIGEVIPYAAICYLLSGREEYLQLARRYLLGIAGYKDWGNNRDIEAAHLLYAAALGYDWLYPNLSEQDRDTIKDKLILQGGKLRPFFGLGHPPLNNHRIVNLSALGIAGLVLYGEAPEAGEWISYVNTQFKNTLDYYGEDGVSCEGISYWSYTVEYMLKYFVAADELLGENFLRHPWLKNAADCPLFHSLPRNQWKENNMFLNFGDSPRFCWYGPYYQLYKLASLYKRPEIQWLADEIFRSGITRWHSDWLSLLWYDPSLKPEAPRDAPLTRFFEDWDIAVMRSGWAGDENILAFKCSSVGGKRISEISSPEYPGSGHSHPDANSFIIFGDGEWLAAAPGSTRIKWTENHNTVVVDGLGQMGEGEQWFNGRLQFKEGRRAGFLAAESRPEYDYVVGDAGAVYREETGLKKFLRHMIYLKPEIIVVVDELSAATPAKFEWLLHTPGEIRIMDRGDVLINNNNSFLQIAVLAPGEAKISSASRAVPAEYPDLDWNKLNVLTISPPQLCRDTIFAVVLLIGDPERFPLTASLSQEGEVTRIEIDTGDFHREVSLVGLGEERKIPGMISSID